MPESHPGRRLPPWLRKSNTHFVPVHELKAGLRQRGLHTVCESARCPNLHECFERGTATFLILGGVCTRNCGFCAVAKGRPAPLDQQEPENVARMAARMGLEYVVVTSVTRDDLEDGGSAHFAATVAAVKRECPGARVEVLTPDFRGDTHAIARVLDAAPHVFNHNLETVPRLYKTVRPQADYTRSLDVLAFAARKGGLVKSGLMAGLGERDDEVRAALRDMREAGVSIATIGQYLQPSRRNLPVTEYVAPGQFESWREYGLSIGFKMVFSGPFVRSSYMADRVSEQA